MALSLPFPSLMLKLSEAATTATVDKTSPKKINICAMVTILRLLAFCSQSILLTNYAENGSIGAPYK